MLRSVTQQSKFPADESTRARRLPRPTLVAMAVSLSALTYATAARAEAPDAPDAPTADATPVVPAAAPAQAGEADKLSPTTEVVTVTATRRREPIRDVPLRVETLGAEGLERAGAVSLDDYVGTLPGVHVADGGGPGRGQVNIRGVDVGSQTAPTVGTYIDDVAFGSSTGFVGEAVAALDMALLDLNHIEVLRGPQGTLYGAGAMGGLIKYVTNDPDASGFSGKAALGLRGTRNGTLGHTENAVINVPLSDGVAAMRVAAFNEHDGGYVAAVGRVPGDHVNDGNTRGARVSLLFDPSKALRIKLTATQQNIDRNGTGIVQYNAATGQPNYGDLRHNLATPEPYTVKTGVVSGDVEYDLGWARLNVIASAQRFKADTALDATDIVGASAFNFARLDNNTTLNKRSAEFRLTSAPGMIEWLAGYYHTKETGDRFQRLYGQLASGGDAITLVTSGQPSSYIENAVYGDVTWNPSRAWSFTLGARAARNRQVYGTETNGVPDFQTPAKDSSDTYLVTGRYSLDNKSSVYFRAASGYRPGGPNPPAIDQNGKVVPGAPTSFEPDTLWSYELGYKGDLLDKRLYVEAALFDIRWNKLQQPIAVGATTLTGNAGKAESRGLELAMRYKVDEHWSADGSLAWTNAKLTEDSPALGPSGSRLPNTARLSATLGARYAFEAAGHPAYAGAGMREVGQRNAGFDAATTSVPNFSMPAYALFDLQAGIDIDAWQLAGFVRNLADKRGLSSADTALTAFGGPLRVTTVQPRTVGVTLTRNF